VKRPDERLVVTIAAGPPLAVEEPRDAGSSDAIRALLHPGTGFVRSGQWHAGSFTAAEPLGSGGLKVIAVLQHLNHSTSSWGYYPGITPVELFRDTKIAEVDEE
jgi:hypothetical protein